MADPFDQNISGQNDASGVSPDFYSNLMNFGLATMAAGSQPGATTLGAIGKGGLATVQSAREGQQLRGQQQLQQQQIIGAQLQNSQQYGQAAMRNMALASGGIPTMPLPNMPGLQMNQPQAQPTAPQTPSAPSGIQPVSASDLQPPPNPSQIAAQQQSAPQGGSTGPTWAATAGYSAAPKTTEYPADGMIPQNQLGSYLMSPAKLAGVTPNQARQLSAYAAQIGMAVPPELEKFGYAGQTAASVAAATQPFENEKIRQQAIYQNHETRGEGGVTTYVDPQTGQEKQIVGRFKSETPQGAGILTPATVTTSGPNGQTTQNIGQPEVPNPSPAGIQISGKPPAGQQTPAVSSGPKMDTSWPTPVPVPENPFGVPAGEALVSLPDYVPKWRDENYPKMANLQTQMQQQSAIDDSLGKLKNATMLQPGTWGEERKGLVDLWNTGNRMIGTPQYDSEKSGADAAEFVKSAQQNTNAAAHEISSRGTNFDIVAAAKANPQYSMPYMAGLVTNSMNSEAVTRNYNRIKYIDARLNQGVSESQATQEFEQQQPGDLVVKRAESVVNPVVANKINITKLLPGTKYVLPGGQQGYIPIPPDYPFMVPYTNPLYKAQRGNQ